MTAITETRQSVETKVIRTRTQTTESARTETASYALDVTRENGILTAVTARVSYPVDGTAPDGSVTVSYREVGTMSWANGTLTAQKFPLSSDTADIIADFAAIIDYLRNKD